MNSGGNQRRVLAGASWLMAARFTTLFVSLFSSAFLARHLGPREFGVVAAVMTVVLLAGTLSDGTFSLPIVQMPTLDESTKATAFWLSLGLGSLLGLAVALGCKLIEAAFRLPGLALPMLVTAAVLPLRSANTVAVAMLQRDHRFRALASATVAANVFGYALPAVWMAWKGFGVWSLVVPSVLSAAIETTANLFCAPMRFSLRPSRNSMRLLFSAGGATTLTQLLNWASLNLPNLIVARTLDAAALGIYSRANNILGLMIQLLANTLSRVLFPTFAKLQGSAPALSRALLRALEGSLRINTVISIAFILHAEVVVRILLGPRWDPAIGIMQLLFAAFVPRAGYKVTESFALGSGRFGNVAMRQAVYLSLVAACCFFGARWGLVGVAGATALGIWLFYGFSLAQSVKLASVGWGAILRLHLRVALATAAMALPDMLVLYALKPSLHLAMGLPGRLDELATLLVVNGLGLFSGLTCYGLLTLFGARPLVGDMVYDLRRRLDFAGRIRKRLGRGGAVQPAPAPEIPSVDTQN